MSVHKIFILLVFNRECMERNVTPSSGMLLSKLSNRNTRVYIQYQNDQFSLPFSVNCSQVAMFQIMPVLSPHGQGEGRWSTKCGQAWTGGGRGPKNSQICVDILYG